MIIAYCEKCGLRVPESDMANGTAVKLDEIRYHCAKCAGAIPGAAAKKPSTRMAVRRAPSPATGTLEPQAAPRSAPARASSGAVTLPAAARVPAPAPPAATISARGAAAAKPAGQPQARLPVPVLIGAVGGVLFLVGLVVALSGGDKEETPAKKGPETSRYAPPVAAPAVAPKTGPEMPAPDVTAKDAEPKETVAPAERAKAAEKELEDMRNDRASRLLNDIQGWFGRNPQDPWTYKDRLEELAASSRSTPAAAEAAKILAALKLPEGERGPESLSWHRDWTAPKTEQTAMTDEKWGRRYVLQTHPVERGVPAVLSRKWKIPEERTILEINIRNHDNGDFRFVADVSGKRMVDETVSGGWRTYALDLSALKGQEAEISLQNHNTGWDHEYAFWQAPRLVDMPPGGAKIVTWAEATPLTLAQDDAVWKNAVDLLALVDPGRDAVAGTWVLKPGEGLYSDLGKHSRIEVPYQPPEEYDYKTVFTRRNSPLSDCLVQLLSCKGRDFGYVLGGWRNTMAGFEDIGDKRCDMNGSGACSPGWVTTGQRHTSVVQVRKDGLRAFLDGKLVSQWKTDYADMSTWREFKLRKTGVLGLATYEAEYCFHSAQLLEVTGKGTRGGGTAPATVVAAPPVETRPAETRAWKALFDGRTVDCLRGQSVGAWRVDNGALVMIPEKKTAAQTALEFEDGDVRARFEVKDSSYMQFTARQCDAGGCTVQFDRSQLPGMYGKTHELVFTCRGDDVTATLDGQPVKVEAKGRPRKGTLQFYARDGTLRVLSIEFAEPGAAPAATAAVAPVAPAAVNLLSDPGFESGGFGAWQRWQDPSTIVDNNARTGKFCARVGPKSGAGQRVGNLTANATYVVTAWVKGTPGEDITLGVQEYGGPPNRYEGMNVSADYKQLTCTFALGANNTSALIFYHKNVGKDFVYLDDLVLTPQAAAVTPAATPAATATAAKAAALDPAAEARLEYERLLADVNVLLLKNGARQALARLGQAKGEPRFAAQRAALDQDIQCAKYVDDLAAAVAKGVAALADKRPFVLKKTDGKETPVGQGSKNTVTRVKDEQIEMDMDMGGGKASMRVPLEQLAPETRFALARIGIAGSPDAEVKGAFANLVLFQAGLTELTPKVLRMQLDAAKKAGAPPERVAHLLSRLEAREREQAGETVFKKLENLLKDKKWPDAKTFIENYRKEYAGTLVLAKVQADLDKQAAEVDYQLNPIRPGLWASYWSGQGADKFKTMYFARPDAKLCYDWKQGSPDPRVPVDEFGVKWAGKLRVERDGKYRFKVEVDDRAHVWIDGKKIIQDKGEQDVMLTRGDHECKFVFEEDGGDARVNVQWKLEGGFDWQEIPSHLLWYEPRQVERYQKD
ncbi:MAG: PA14 domain-containing protein [Planctomycetota bacterium]|nr:PA14 domain-containing protein [Planctomycetota bacterium]